jgi:transposase
MYRITLTEEQRHDLRERTRRAGLAPSTRDRLEMVRLSDAGWSVPRIARHLGHLEQTVRTWIKAFLTGEFDALPNKPRGGKESALSTPLLERGRAEGARGTRPWTAAQLADWGAAHQGVRRSGDRLRLQLRRATICWQRTSRPLRHKQDPDEGAEREAVLTDLAQGGRQACSIWAIATQRAWP